MKLICIILITFSFNNFCFSEDEGREPAAFYEKHFTFTFKNTSLESALHIIAEKSGLHLKMNASVSGQVNYSLKDSTLEDAMEKITELNNLDYKISDGVLIVRRMGREVQASSSEATTSLAPLRGPASDLDLTYRSIPIRFASAHELALTLLKNVKNGESLTPDESSNSLIVYSSEDTFRKIQDFVALVDKRPFQILIEAKIVETSKNFARDLGISWGDPQAAGGTAPSAGILNPAPGNPNFVFRSVLGKLNDRTLELNLQAAETRGDAKVISRPKVFTLNNKKATIHSGVTYNIRTLTNIVSSGSASGGTSGGSSSSSVSGGLKEITSGLQLDVTPTVVGEGLVRLAIKVSNSEPDSGNAVDGIPGINDNSADTSILVKGGQTATIGGLLKNSVSKTEQGVPWLSSIPVLGWLFKSQTDRDTTSELVIFITPHVVDAVGEEKAALKEIEKSEDKTERKPAAEKIPEKVTEKVTEKPAPRIN